MSAKSVARRQREARCKICNGSSGQHAMCATCDPTRSTTAHIDKYAAKQAGGDAA